MSVLSLSNEAVEKVPQLRDVETERGVDAVCYAGECAV